ncbi:MAG TPA: class I adenylate-forming enzyme family protein, partial [Blastocatellia bacterium]|nr:class I adenylate-forming enzyme family protein [Blastocatellia bacterium]
MVEKVARSIVDYLATHARERAEQTAVISDDRELSFSELDHLSGQCRRVFKDLGVKRGDRVALIMCDGPEWVAAFLGVIGLGAIAVPCSTMLGAAEIRSILRDCGARLAVVTPDQRESMRAVLSEQSPPELEVVLAAGGEAWEPEGVATLSLEAALAGVAGESLADFDSETLALILYTSG